LLEQLAKNLVLLRSKLNERINDKEAKMKENYWILFIKIGI